MAINRIGVRVIAVLLCLSLVVYISVGRVHADGGVVSIPVGIGIAVVGTLIVGSGIILGTSEEARVFARVVWQQIQSDSLAWEGVKLQVRAACLAYMRDGIDGLRETVTMQTISDFMTALVNMGMTKDGISFDVPDCGFTLGSVLSVGSSYDPYSLGSHFVVYDSVNGYMWVVGPSYRNGVKIQSNYMRFENWDKVTTVTGSIGSVYTSIDSTSYIYTNPDYRILDSAAIYSYVTGYSAPTFGIRWENIETGAIGYLPNSSYGGNRPPDQNPNIVLMTVAAALGGTAALINYVWEKDIVENHLQKKEPSAPVYFTQVVTPETAPGKRTGDVIRWSDEPSGGESSEPETPEVPDNDSPITVGGLATLFLPRENFLSEQFNNMFLKIPELGNLDELRGLAELGEKKPVMNVVLNDYFGISTTQSGVDIDIWDDKRNLFKSWIRAALIIFNIIFGFNQCYKLVKNGSFTDTGTGSNNNQIEGQQRWFS